MNILKFISAQPDVPYFHWQCEIYGYNFKRLGIDPNDIVMLFGLQGDEPSDGLKKLSEKYNVHFYKDTRNRKYYPPSLKPHLIWKYLKDNPTEKFCLHDSDILFRKLPDFSRFNDDKIYLSDTKSYIGYQYLLDCCQRYKEKFPQTQDRELIRWMMDEVGIPIDLIEKMDENAGGAQYIFSNQDWRVWKKIERDAQAIYDKMTMYQKVYPLSNNPVQFWTAEMWAVLWNLWFFEYETKITKELDFSWASDNKQLLMTKNIFHCAGITKDTKEGKFYKGDFIEKNPINLLKNNPTYFDYVSTNSASFFYIQEMKDFVRKME
jgi:hypothetical protein